MSDETTGRRRATSPKLEGFDKGGAEGLRFAARIANNARRSLRHRTKVKMFRRLSILWLMLPFVPIPQVYTKGKKEQVLPDYVLKAEQVAVVILPESGEPLTNPAANRIARENVEKALLKWGRFNLVMDPQEADLIFAVRKGHADGPAIANSPSDNPPVVIEQAGGITRVGGRTGPPIASSARPHIQEEVGSADDLLEVFRGGIELSQGPLSVNGSDATMAPPIWRYMGKKSLEEPRVEAVEQFKKVFAEAEKAQKKKP